MATFKGIRKTDDGDNYAKVTLIVADLNVRADDIKVNIPKDRSSRLEVLLNGRELFGHPLPDEIIFGESTYKVNSGSPKSEIVVKLRKRTPGKWLSRWGSAGSSDSD